MLDKYFTGQTEAVDRNLSVDSRNTKDEHIRTEEETTKGELEDGETVSKGGQLVFELKMAMNSVQHLSFKQVDSMGDLSSMTVPTIEDKPI